MTAATCPCSANGEPPQIAARNYDFNSDFPFTVADVLDMFPVVKHINPRCAEGQELLEVGKAHLIARHLCLCFLNFLRLLTVVH
jgi:hypothetical protein